MLKFQRLDGLRLEDDFAQLLESAFSTRKPKRFFYFCRHNVKKIEESGILCIGPGAGSCIGPGAIVQDPAPGGRLDSEPRACRAVGCMGCLAAGFRCVHKMPQKSIFLAI